MTDWMDYARCAKEDDPDLFFPSNMTERKQALRVCRRCPVSEECLEYSIEHGEFYGIWGGKTVGERKVIARLAA